MDSLEIQIDAATAFVDLVDQALLQSAVESALAAGISDSGDTLSLPRIAPTRGRISIRVTDDDEMQRVNREYRGVDAPTDVLSFAFIAEPRGPKIRSPAGQPVEFGEILLDWPYAERQAHRLGHSVDTEIAWLAIHGTLQLLGYTHADDTDAERMEALELQALSAIGISVE